MYILYDRETFTTVKCTKADTKQECLWKAFGWLTEGWDGEMYDQAFQHDTLEDVLDNYNYEVRNV